MKRHWTCCGRTLALVCFSVAGAGGAMGSAPVSIAVSNPGFEEDVVSPGCFQVLNMTGWPAYDPHGILDGGQNAVGGLNIPPGSVWFPAGAPEGEHAALVFIGGAIGAGPAGLSQVLGEVLQAETTYRLSVQVGNIASGTGPPPCDVFGFFDLDGFPGYQVQLLAGGVVVAEDDNSLAGTLQDGEFGLSETEVCIGASHPQVGQPLEIRLINLNQAETPEHPGIEVDFDDVQLTAQPNGAALPGNLDNDCDVDLDDHALLAACVGGPNQPLASTCPPGITADLDSDGDSDLADFARFQALFGGS